MSELINQLETRKAQLLADINTWENIAVKLRGQLKNSQKEIISMKGGIVEIDRTILALAEKSPKKDKSKKKKKPDDKNKKQKE